MATTQLWSGLITKIVIGSTSENELFGFAIHVDANGTTPSPFRCVETPGVGNAPFKNVNVKLMLSLALFAVANNWPVDLLYIDEGGSYYFVTDMTLTVLAKSP